MSQRLKPRRLCSTEVARGRSLLIPRGAGAAELPPSPNAPAITVLKSIFLPDDVAGSDVLEILHAESTLRTLINDVVTIGHHILDVVLLPVKALIGFRRLHQLRSPPPRNYRS